MSKKQKKKYSPGELERTRKNLGKISKDEAQKMAKKLGGEIGIEEDPEDVINKYKELRSKSYGRIVGRKDRSYRRSLHDQQMAENKEKLKKTDENEQIEKKIHHVSFIDRIRLDFLCSKPEFQLKPLSGAIASLFSFIFPIPDNVNPSFIMKSRIRFYTTLFDFVTAIRSLYTKTNKQVFKAISENTFFAQILTAIKNWDINGINLELNMLRRHSNRLNINKLIRLSVFIY